MSRVKMLQKSERYAFPFKTCDLSKLLSVKKYCNSPYTVSLYFWQNVIVLVI